MSLSPADIKSIVTALHDSDWDEAVVTVGDSTISLARNGARNADTTLAVSAASPVSTPAPAPAAPPTIAADAAVAPAPAPAAVRAAAPAEGAPADLSAPDDFVVKAPSVGVLWRSPEPGAAPFAAIGDRLEVGDTICIVEIMKLMNNVATPVAGVLTAAHVANGGAVAAGDPMFSIRVE